MNITSHARTRYLERIARIKNRQQIKQYKEKLDYIIDENIIQILNNSEHIGTDKVIYNNNNNPCFTHYLYNKKQNIILVYDESLQSIMTLYVPNKDNNRINKYIKQKQLIAI
jgi:hypothetical protein